MRMPNPKAALIVRLLPAAVLLLPLACQSKTVSSSVASNGNSPTSVKTNKTAAGGDLEPVARNGNSAVKPQKFVHDPKAILATKLMQEKYLTDAKEFEKKYKDRILTVEGRVSLVGPYFQKGRAYLYGFTQNEFKWLDSSFTEDDLMVEDVVSFATEYDAAELQKINALKHGQWVRVRGKVWDASIHVHLMDAEVLSIGLVPKTDSRSEQYITEKEFKQQVARDQKICKQLQALKAEADVVGNHPSRLITNTVELKPENYTPNGSIKTEVLALLKQLPHLHLRLVETTISDAGLKQIGELSQLRALRVEYRAGGEKRISAAGLAALANLTKLRQLDIKTDSSSQKEQIAGGKELAAFGQLTDLESLDLSGVRLKDDEVGFLSRLTRLRVLKLKGPTITDRAMPDWKQLPGLRELYLRETAVTSNGLQQIAECGELRYVNLSKSNIDGRLLPALSKLPFLRDLRMNASKVGGADMNSFTAHRFLEVVELNNTGVGDAAMGTLATLPRLRLLSIRNTKVTDAGLLKFQNRQSELSIYCSEQQITEEGRKQLMRKRIKARVRRSSF